MHLRLCTKIIASLAGLMGAFLAFPLVLALFFDEPTRPFWGAMLAAFALFALGLFLGRNSRGSLSTRDGFLIVAFGWAVASAIAALPYVFSGWMGPVDAWFEAVSGITTTGSTILTDIEALERSLLFWRSFTQWIGGMGIILFTIAVLPLLGVGGMQLFKAEVPGPVADKISPRLAVTARYLWSIYVGLTGLEWLLLSLGGMPVLEALDHSFTTLATGGFSPRNASLAAYDSHYLHVVVIVFMFLAGMNFCLHFKLVFGRVREVFEDEEFRWYIALMLIFVVPTVVGLLFHGTPFFQALEDALFTVTSLMTTTGYATANYELWPLAIKGPIILLLIFGGMAGSTGGGVKTMRTLLSFRALRASFRRMEHPHAVRPVVYKGRPVPADTLAAIWGFFASYIILAILGMIVLNWHGHDLITSWSAALTALGNVGPGLANVGPTDNFGWMYPQNKLLLSFLMLCGRLEIYTVLLLFAPSFWRR